MILYENYTNYIYKIESSHKIFEVQEELFLLFNPSIASYTVIDKKGKEIYECIKEYKDEDIVRKSICEKYDISNEDYENTVEVFIQMLIKRKFLAYNNMPAEALWMRKEYNNYEVEKYNFEDIYISITENCNLKCVYCFNHIDRERRKNKSILNTDEIIRVLSEFKELGGKRVVFTGGEPTLAVDFLELCRKSKQIGLSVSIITNGTLLNKYRIEDIINVVDNLNISIDSSDDRIQAKLWDVEQYSVTENVISFIEELNNFCETNKIKYSITIMPVLTKYNYNSLNDLLERIYRCSSTYLHVNWVLTQYSCINIDHVDRELSITQYEYDTALWSAFNNKISYQDMIELILNSGGKNIIKKKPHMVMCEPSFFVTREGDVYPCQGLENDNMFLGNVRNHSLKELFNKEVFRDLTRKLHVKESEKCRECPFRNYCNNKAAKPCTKETIDNCIQDIIFRLYMNVRGKKVKDEYEIKPKENK